MSPLAAVITNYFSQFRSTTTTSFPMFKGTYLGYIFWCSSTGLEHWYNWNHSGNRDFLEVACIGWLTGHGHGNAGGGGRPVEHEPLICGWWLHFMIIMHAPPPFGGATDDATGRPWSAKYMVSFEGRELIGNSFKWVSCSKGQEPWKRWSHSN